MPSDSALVTAVRTGKGDPAIYGSTDFVYLPSLFGGIAPKEPYTEENEDGFFQVTKGSPAEIQAKGPIGTNNLSKAVAVQNIFSIKQSRNPDVEDDVYSGFEEKLLKAFEDKFGTDPYKGTKLHLFTIQALSDAVGKDIEHDFSLITAAIVLVCIYTFLFLGSFSPTHCRAVVAITGLVCILLAYLSGFGLLYLCGGRTTGVHQLMPFLLVGIGADDMFVVCNAVDQTVLGSTAEVRIGDALGHAGPAITITSLTNALAFAFGATTSLEALSSFCMFAAVCIVMLYLLVNTVFLAVVVWDTRRVEKKMHECCGACACSEDTILCCKGKFLAQKQRTFSGIELTDAQKAQRQADEEKYDAAVRTTLDASTSERCLGKYFAPVVLSKIGRIVFLVIYAVLIGLFAYGTSQVTIHFDFNFFISESSPVFGYFEATNKYFDNGPGVTTIYFESDTLDWTEPEIQDKVTLFNKKLEECAGCEKDWHQTNSLQSWLPKFQQFVAKGGCSPSYTPATQDIVAVPKDKFGQCIQLWARTDIGRSQFGNIAVNEDTGKIRGWRQTINPNSMDAIASDGP